MAVDSNQAPSESSDPVRLQYCGQYIKVPKVAEPFYVIPDNPPSDLVSFVETVHLPSVGSEEQYLDEVGWLLGPNGERPQIYIMTQWHHEADGHTWYCIHCHAVVENVKNRHWEVRRRLLHMRSLLHDPVKEALGEEYKTHFEKTPFASYGAPEGTTLRLRHWFETLGRLVNEGWLSRTLTALLLAFLQLPTPEPDLPVEMSPSHGVVVSSLDQSQGSLAHLASSATNFSIERGFEESLAAENLRIGSDPENELTPHTLLVQDCSEHMLHEYTVVGDDGNHTDDEKPTLDLAQSCGKDGGVDCADV